MTTEKAKYKGQMTNSQLDFEGNLKKLTDAGVIETVNSIIEFIPSEVEIIQKVEYDSKRPNDRPGVSFEGIVDGAKITIEIDVPSWSLGRLLEIECKRETVEQGQGATTHGRLSPHFFVDQTPLDQKDLLRGKIAGSVLKAGFVREEKIEEFKVRFKPANIR